MALSSNLLITVVVDKASIGNFVLKLAGGQVTLTSFAEKDEPAKTDTGLHLPHGLAPPHSNTRTCPRSSLILHE